MDCRTFRKQIPAYIREELTDEELLDFYAHLNSCSRCCDELEISYIVDKGIELLENDRTDFNIIAAFHDSVSAGQKELQKKKRIHRVTYIIDTLAFWLAAAALFVFLRITFFG